MSYEKYYKILKLDQNASKDQVRKQYRKLAMHIHPDKNPSPEAKQKFIELSEAYEMILAKVDAPISKKAPNKPTQEERMKRAKERYYEQIAKEKSLNDLYYKRLFSGKKWKLIQLTAVIGPLLSLLIILDVFLPRHFENDRVVSYSKTVFTLEENNQVSLVRTEKGKDYWISNLDYYLCAAYPECTIEKSWIFHEPIYLLSNHKYKWVPYPIYYTFYSLRLLLIVFLLLPLFVRIWRKQTMFYTMTYHISLYLSTVLIILFIAMNQHWIHLITLGFV